MYSQAAGHSEVIKYRFAFEDKITDHIPDGFLDELNDGMKIMDIRNRDDLEHFSKLFGFRVPERDFNKTGLLQYLGCD